MATLEDRLARLEDIDEIRRMRTEELLIWDHAINSGHQPDFEAMVQRYTEDAIIDVGVFGSFRGHDAIRDYFTAYAGQLRLSLHHVSGHIVYVVPGGTEASGRRYCLETDTVDGKAMLFGMIIDERYRKSAGGWHVAYMKANVYHMTPYEGGWAAPEATA